MAASGSPGTSTLAIVGAVFAGLSLIVSVLSLVVSAVTRRAAALAARQEHVRGVTLFHQMALGRITPENHAELVIRNDGPHAVTIGNFCLAFGNRWRQDRRRPEAWSYQYLLSSYLLPPGEEVRVDAPDPVVGVALIGPWATITDALGQRWEVTEATRRPIVTRYDRRPRRRDAWFERRSWWPRVNEALAAWWTRRSQAKPWLFPWLPLIVGAIWGWRPGAGSRIGMPFDAPIGWRYAPGARFDEPDVPAPTYAWRNARPS